MPDVIKHPLIIGYSFLLKLLGKIGIMRLFGTKVSLGLSAALAPAIGFFAQPSSCLSIYLLRTAFSLMHSVSLLGGTYYLPTLAGSLTLSAQSRVLTSALALICIATFLVHPIGAQSGLYTLYWLIPIAISIFPTSSIFLRSLSSTFITHAVGSTLFLYTHPTTSIYWHTLMPQVWLERLAYALILTTCYYVVTFIIRAINQFRLESTLCQNQSPSL